MAMFRFRCEIYHADDGEAWELDSHQVPLALKFVTGRLPSWTWLREIIKPLQRPQAFVNYISIIENINEIQLV
jgi:hypothetical protein